MADPAALDTHQHLAALGVRAIDDRLAQRGFIGGEGEAAELSHARILTRSNARASATKPSTGMSSARAVGAMPAASSSASGSGPSVLRLWRNILRRCPNAAAVTRSSSLRSHDSGFVRGTSSTSDDVTLGGGTNADG